MKVTKEEFIRRSVLAHNGFYDYSLVNLEGMDKEVTIICPKHGMFRQVAYKHSIGQGCQECKLEKISSAHLSARKKIYGKGINDLPDKLTKDGHTQRAYREWRGMFSRCYGKVKEKEPSYIGCTVCDEWKYFSNFKQWFDKNYIDGNHLDKDILVKGNKMYSPETCCFVPQRINSILVLNKKNRGRYPIGVFMDKQGYYCSQFHWFGKHILIGRFKTVQEAFLAYKDTKEKYIRIIAKDYYERGLIKQNVFNALMNYKIEIND